MGNYIPLTEDDEREMLEKIGVGSVDELFGNIPSDIKTGELNIPSGLSELEVSSKIKKIAAKNKVYPSVFRGAGAYRHYIPSIVKSVASKEEFLTAYTPYQAEISQGILQSVFEYQTMICSLTGMDVSNASVYDGASAAAEAIAMCRDRKKNKAVISSAVNPEVLKTVKTYCCGNGIELTIVGHKDGLTDIQALKNAVCKEGVGCVYIQQPNFFGLIEPAEEIGKIAKDAKVKYIMGVNPISMGILKTPKEYGADIAVGEGQPLGLPMSFGGPYLGFMAAVSDMMRKMPGRIVGETVDSNGKRAYVLTLQAREQHIRREKAFGNICSNEALCALTASVYMAAMGGKGIEKAARLSVSKAHYMAKRLDEIGFKLKYTGEFFNEFVTHTAQPISRAAEDKLEKNNILSGLVLDENSMLWCCTELNTKEEIDNAVDILKKG